MTEPLIIAENIGKKFCRDLKRSLWYGVKDTMSDFAGRGLSPNLRKGEFWSNKGINFEVRRGECLGLIGRNGAGKTTLLKVISGLIKPDEGKLTVSGSVGGLIALGAGFNPILSGRENIAVNGAIMGLSRKQVTDKIEQIVEFAELGEFIDTPVRNYSSGMSVRLGFSIAANLIKPDVLLLDEVLAVGDASFRARCYEQVAKLMESSAVILVSHTMGFINQCCSQVGLMSHGELTLYSDTKEAICEYERHNKTVGLQNNDNSIRRIQSPILNADIRVLNANIQYGDNLEFEITIESTEELRDVTLSIPIVDYAGNVISCVRSDHSPNRLSIRRGINRIRMTAEKLHLNEGRYTINFNSAQSGSMSHFIWFQSVGLIHVSSPLPKVDGAPYVPAILSLTTNCE